MNRVIKIAAKDKNRDYGLQSMQIEVRISANGLTQDELNAKVERLRDQFFNVAACHFNVSQIKQ